jgi:hypothetical protein
VGAEALHTLRVHLGFRDGAGQCCEREAFEVSAWSAAPALGDCQAFYTKIEEDSPFDW